MENLKLKVSRLILTSTLVTVGASLALVMLVILVMFGMRFSMNLWGFLCSG